MIRIKNVEKKYGAKSALKKVSLQVPKGALYGFLGSNGAGKTTMMSILCGLIKKSDGSVQVNGYNLDKELSQIKKSVGVMIQHMNLFENKTIGQNLGYYARLKGLKGDDLNDQIRSLAKELEFSDFLDRYPKKLSHGEQKLAMIAQAFLGSPQLVLLDEPVSGFDPQKIVVIRNFLRKKNKTTTIVLSSHNLSEIDKLSSHIGILHEGSLLASGSKKAVKKNKSLEQAFITYLRAEK